MADFFDLTKFTEIGALYEQAEITAQTPSHFADKCKLSDTTTNNNGNTINLTHTK